MPWAGKQPPPGPTHVTTHTSAHVGPPRTSTLSASKWACTCTHDHPLSYTRWSPNWPLRAYQTTPGQTYTHGPHVGLGYLPPRPHRSRISTASPWAYISVRQPPVGIHTWPPNGPVSYTPPHIMAYTPTWYDPDYTSLHTPGHQTGLLYTPLPWPGIPDWGAIVLWITSTW